MPLRPRRKAYKQPPFPDGPFMLVELSNGMEEGPFVEAMFDENDDGSWIAATDGRPIILRVTQIKDGVVTLEDGSHELRDYRMVSWTAPTPPLPPGFPGLLPR